MIEIEKGWRFYTADFSVRASNDSDALGGVTLIRDPDSRAEWHKMSDELKDALDGPELYVHGTGSNIESAILSANSFAKTAKPIQQEGE